MVHSTAEDVVAAEDEGKQCTAIAANASHAEGVGTIAGSRASPINSFLPSKSIHTAEREVSGRSSSLTEGVAVLIQQGSFTATCKMLNLYKIDDLFKTGHKAFSPFNISPVPSHTLVVKQNNWPRRLIRCAIPHF